MNENDTILIAIADDHILLRRGLADLIDSFGFFKVIIEADNGKELLAMIRVAGSMPHICILDINMPEMDGFGALAELRKNWPAIKVLALSMYNNEFTIIRMLRNGASGYLLKNCHPNKFKDALLDIYYKGIYETTEQKEKNTSNRPDAETVSITNKEIEFLKYCCSELAYKEIANKMGISPRTVEDYRDNLFKKLKLNTRIGLVIYAIKTGIFLND